MKVNWLLDRLRLFWKELIGNKGVRTLVNGNEKAAIFSYQLEI